MHSTIEALLGRSTAELSALSERKVASEGRETLSSWDSESEYVDYDNFEPRDFEEDVVANVTRTTIHELRFGHPPLTVAEGERELRSLFKRARSIVEGQRELASTAASLAHALGADLAASDFSAAASIDPKSSNRARWSHETKKTKAEGRRNPSQFIRDEYASDLKTLTLAELRRRDKHLYDAYCTGLSRWRKLPKKRRDPRYDLQLPKDSDRVDAELESLGIQSIDDLAEFAESDPRQAERLRGALRRRF